MCISSVLTVWSVAMAIWCNYLAVWVTINLVRMCMVNHVYTHKNSVELSWIWESNSGARDDLFYEETYQHTGTVMVGQCCKKVKFTSQRRLHNTVYFTQVNAKQFSSQWETYHQERVNSCYWICVHGQGCSHVRRCWAGPTGTNSKSPGTRGNLWIPTRTFLAQTISVNKKKFAGFSNVISHKSQCLNRCRDKIWLWI